MPTKSKIDNIIIERDLPIRMDDGVVLRADVYRPDTDKKVPIVMAGGPYQPVDEVGTGHKRPGLIL